MDLQRKEKFDSILQLEQYNPFSNIAKEDLDKVRAIHNNENFPVSIRLNPGKPFEHTLNDQVPWCSYGYYLANRPSFTLDPIFHAGGYYVQEASSMFVAHAFQHIKTLIGNQHNIKVLDLCAAPGGKSTLLASYLKEEDLLISNEFIANRANILVENLTKWGQMNTWVTNNDPADFAQIPQFFDVMLIDAPCTGSGLWRRDPTALDEWTIQNVKQCVERQKKIINDAFSALKDGGYLIYATCSFSPEEDEHIMNYIEQEFDVNPITLPIDESWNIEIGYSENKKACGYHFYPWKLRGEGFFLTVYQKNKDLESVRFKKEKNNKPSKSKSNISTAWQDFLATPFTGHEINNDIYAFHPNHLPIFIQLKPLFYFKKAGILLGQQGMKEVIPHHELALSHHLSKQIPFIEVTEQEALHYLKKEAVRTDANLKGWYAIEFKQLKLGWGKWMPGRMNNYLPKNWRIRMDIQ